jgi:hypothetical protein
MMRFSMLPLLGLVLLLETGLAAGHAGAADNKTAASPPTVSSDAPAPVLAAPESLPLSVLSLRWGRRKAGKYVTGRSYLDFVIDGRSLYKRLDSPDAVTLLGWLEPDQHEAVISELLLLKPTALAENRRELYVCPECGDIGCGSITAVVTKHGDRVIWSDFAHYVNYTDDGATDHAMSRKGYEHIGPFAFDAKAYAATFESGREMLKHPPKIRKKKKAAAGDKR